MVSREEKGMITALGVKIGVTSTGGRDDFISLTDIARYKSDHPDDVVKNWLRNRNTIEFLGTWETLHNPSFNSVEFDGFRSDGPSYARAEDGGMLELR